MDPEEHPAVKKYLSRLGKLGAAARAKALTPHQREMIARKAGRAAQAKLTPQERSKAMTHAVRARWARVRAKKKSG